MIAPLGGLLRWRPQNPHQANIVGRRFLFQLRRPPPKRGGGEILVTAELHGSLTALTPRFASFNPDRSRVRHDGTVHEVRSRDYDGARAADTDFGVVTDPETDGEQQVASELTIEMVLAIAKT